jgi:RNA polymerase sigma factor (sigma-70 family)
MTDDGDQWRRLIQGLRDGDAAVVRAFWEQYGELLHQVAEKHLAEGLRRRVGPEDVVQSACRTFLRRARGGEFKLEDSAGLWRLLCAITLTKIREQTRFHLRQKRGLDQERQAAWGTGDSAAGPDPAARGPSPDDAVAIADELRQLLNGLDEEERQVVDLVLQEYTQDEIAERMGCSERTVRRIFKRIKSRLARQLGEV